MINKLATHVALILFGLFVLMLLIRTSIFARRFGSETADFFVNRNKPSEFMPQIQPCADYSRPLTDEEQHLLNYRSIGVTCAN